MKTKHTSGHWAIGNQGSQIVSDSSEGLTIGGARDEGAAKYYGGYLIAESVSINNLNIIAAAPDLLNALIEISEAKGTYSLDRMEHAENTIRDMVQLAKKAIKKAIN